MQNETKNGGLRFTGGLCVFFGILLLASSLALILHNMQESNRAAEASETIMIQFAEVRPPLHLPAETMPPMQGSYPSPAPTPVPEMPTVTIDGYDYIGSLTVPSLSLELPVMADWDYDRLKISPCVFSGNYFSDDLVICGHNFPSHFSPLREIPMGEEVLFTSADGAVYRYVVSNRETVKPDDVATMTTNAHSASPGTGDWDLTLFTCNLGGQTRCAVRCVRSDNK